MDVPDAILVNNIADDNNLVGNRVGRDVSVGIAAPSRVDYNYWGDGNFVAAAACDANSLKDGDILRGVPVTGPGFVNPDAYSVDTDVTSPNFAKCFALRLREKEESICVDAGDSLARLIGAPSGNTLTINRNAASYFTVGDEIRVTAGNRSTRAFITDISGNIITLNGPISASIFTGARVDLVIAYGDAPDMGAYERSTHPWVIDPPGIFSHTIQGTAKIGSEHLAVGDWIGVLDEDGNCYGAGQYQYDPDQDRHYYMFEVYAESFTGAGDGFASDEKLYFEFCVAGMEPISAVAEDLVPRRYPIIADHPIHGTTDYEVINLIAAAEQKIWLEPGWNFISFNIQPDSTVLEEAFSSILIAENDHLEYVCDHVNFWSRDIVDNGLLTDVDAYHSYILKLKDTSTEGCMLTIRGRAKVLPTHPFTLEPGWCNISYLPDTEAWAIKNADDEYRPNGIFSGIMDSIVWMKSAKGTGDDAEKELITSVGRFSTCTPTENCIKVGPGRGIFIKIKDDAGEFDFKYYDVQLIDPLPDL
jgi:hypothetical protein